MKDIATIIDHFLSQIVAEEHVPKMTKNEQKSRYCILIFFGRYQPRKLRSHRRSVRFVRNADLASTDMIVNADVTFTTSN